MDNNSINKIALIGAGNVATQLGKAFKRSGKSVIQVYSRSKSTAEMLSEVVGAESISDIYQLTNKADLYVISVPDNAITNVLSDIRLKDRLLVHTSGALPMDVLSVASLNIGVFYTLQTFSKEKDIEFKDTPICIEANTTSNKNLLFELAEEISENVRYLDSDLRKIAHLAAVFANNFTNYMYTIALDILEKHNLPFDLIRPLINETAEIIKNNRAYEMQTGPAIRNDEETVRKHLEYLKAYPEYQQIYDMITKSIMTRHKKANEDDKL